MKTITKTQIEKIIKEREKNNTNNPNGLIDYITFTFVDKKGNTFTKNVPSNVCINTEYFTIRKGGSHYSYNNVVSIKCHYSKEYAQEIKTMVSNIQLITF